MAIYDNLVMRMAGQLEKYDGCAKGYGALISFKDSLIETAEKLGVRSEESRILELKLMGMIFTEDARRFAA
jgi:hypothetical protein